MPLNMVSITIIDFFLNLFSYQKQDTALDEATWLSNVRNHV